MVKIFSVPAVIVVGEKLFINGFVSKLFGYEPEILLEVLLLKLALPVIFSSALANSLVAIEKLKTPFEIIWLFSSIEK